MLDRGAFISQRGGASEASSLESSNAEENAEMPEIENAPRVVSITIRFA